MKRLKTAHYRVTSEIALKDRNTYEDFGESDKALKKELKSIRKELARFQDTLYAHARYAVLICLQGTDTAGKDSLIREVFKDLNVRGIVVHSFKVPTAKELKHDYLWRHYIALPEKGKFGVFNRTHYENVLVTRVHPEYLMYENIPGISTPEDVDQRFWDKRFEQINTFERHIVENGTIVFKFFLHLSREAQRLRLLRRLQLKEKNWKFSPGDLEERALWDRYQACYEEAINRTSMAHAPWYVIPADSKEASRLIVASILLETLSTYSDIREPELDADIKAKMESYTLQLEKEKE